MSFTGKEEYLFVLLFASPALLAILVYLLFVPLIYAETGYIVNANNDINASNVLNISFNAYKNHGKRARFGILVINSLIKICYLVLAGIGSALPIFIKGYTTNALGLTIIFGIIALIPYIIFAPLFTLGTISSLTLLNDDIVKDTLTNIVSATNVKFTIPKKDVENLTTEEKLVYIFDNTEDLSPSIKNLKILDSLEVADEKDIETNEETISKVEEEKPSPIKEEIVNNEIVEDVEENKEVLEENKEQSFEAIKEASDENITDSIVEEVNSEKVNEEVVDKLENEQETSESKDFEAIKEVSGDAKDDTIEENKTDDDTVSITEVLENDSEPIEEAKEEAIDTLEEETTQDDVPITEEKEEPIVDETPSIETVEENTKVMADEPITSESPSVETIEENNDEVISEEETKEIQEDVKDTLEEEKVEEMPQESDNLEETNSDNKEEDFDFDLFDEKENKDDELLNEMEDFLKKGDD
jgi:hypothetical protein